MRRREYFLIIPGLAFVVFFFPHFYQTSAQADQRPLLVFASISMKSAIEPIIAHFERETGTDVTLSLAGSSTLARQIAAGAPADVFISADIDWATWLKTQNLADPNSSRIVARNQLALIVPKNAPVRDGEKVTNVLRKWLESGKGRLAIADPDNIPAGRYARAALKKLEASIGPYKYIEKRIAVTGNVRLASILVGRGEVPLGIVYRSEAVSDPRIKSVGLFPTNTHPEIVYPAIKLNGSQRGANAFLSYLETDVAKKHFVRAGLFVPN